MTREELYQLVWSRPTSSIARELGLSDVGLAKRCRKLEIPLPPRGYWARFAVGQMPSQTPLPERTAAPIDEFLLKFKSTRRSTTAQAAPTPNGPAVISNIDPQTGSAPVKGTALSLDRLWAGKIRWQNEEAAGLLQFDVSESAAGRALLICDRLLQAAASRGWTFESASGASNAPAPLGCLRVKGQLVGFKLQEVRRRVPRVLTGSETADAGLFSGLQAPKWDLIPTGLLSLSLVEPGPGRTGCTWTESARNPLEGKLSTILSGFEEFARRMNVRDEQRREADLHHRQRALLDAQLSDRRRASGQLVQQLEAQAGAWFRARLLRAYLRALRRAAPQTNHEFLAWAQRYIDQLDPLCPTRRDPELIPDRIRRPAPSDPALSELLRLMGHNWAETVKLNPLE